MPPVTGRRLLAGLLGVALGSLPIAPPEHVHEAAAQSHPHLIVHRHGELHPAWDALLPAPPVSTTMTDPLSR